MTFRKVDWFVAVSFVAVTSIALVVLAEGGSRSLDQEQEWCRQRGLKYTTMSEWDGEVRVRKVVCVGKRRRPVSPGKAEPS